MRRTILTIVAGCFAFLGTAALLLWVRSFWVCEYIGWSGSWRDFGIESNRGLLAFILRPDSPLEGGGSGFYYHPIHSADISPFTLDKPVRWFEYAPPHWMLNIPDWMLCVLFAAIAAIAFRLGNGKYPHGLCSQCGYDLRASRHRCPECGSTITGQLLRRPCKAGESADADSVRKAETGVEPG